MVLPLLSWTLQQSKLAINKSGNLNKHLLWSSGIRIDASTHYNDSMQILAGGANHFNSSNLAISDLAKATRDSAPTHGAPSRFAITTTLESKLKHQEMSECILMRVGEKCGTAFDNKANPQCDLFIDSIESKLHMHTNVEGCARANLYI